MAVNTVKKGRKQGSIPMVMIIAVTLGTMGISSLFMSQGSARLDKKAQLREKAMRIAQTAAEEILVKITNGKAEWIEKEQTGDTQYKKNVYTPYVTRFLINQRYPGAKIENVRVMGRTLEQPNDVQVRGEFEQLFTAAPAFAKPIPGVEGSGHRTDWYEKLPADLKSRFASDLKLTGLGRALHNQYFEVGENGVSKLREEEKALKDIDQTVVQDGKRLGNLPGQGIGDAFEELLPVDQVGIKAFKAQWDVCMDRIANRVEMRFQGCGADQTFILAGILGAFTLGARAESFAPSELGYRYKGLDGGSMKYTKNLVTVNSRAKIREGMFSAAEELTAHRIVQTVNNTEVLSRLRKKVALYLIANYNLSLAQMEELGWVEQSGRDFEAKAEIFTKLSERFGDVPAPRVYPFQVATGLGASQ